MGLGSRYLFGLMRSVSDFMIALLAISEQDRSPGVPIRHDSEQPPAVMRGLRPNNWSAGDTESPILTKVGILPIKKANFGDQQITFALQRAEAGTPMLEVCSKMRVSEQTSQRVRLARPDENHISDPRYGPRIPLRTTGTASYHS